MFNVYRMLFLALKRLESSKPLLRFPLLNNPTIVKYLFTVKNNSLKFHFPFTITLEWSKPGLNIRISASLTKFKNLIMKFVRLNFNSVFNVHGVLRY